MMVDNGIDFTDIPEIADFSGARKNPYFDKIKKHGFSITEHYTAEDVANIIDEICTRKIDVMKLDAEEQQAYERYKQAHGYE